MSINGTFRSVVRPNKVLITTDLAGVLSFAQRATSLVINSGQSLPMSSVTNTEHLIPNQVIAITNKSGADVIIAANLMEQNTLIDIEHGTTVALIWTDNNKFYDIGGSSTVKNITDDVEEIKTFKSDHNHNGTNGVKIKATDLDPSGGVPGQFLLLNGSGVPYWHDPLTGTAEQSFLSRNTDITTNLNQASPVIAPLVGTIEKTSSYFSPIGNTVRINNFTGWIKVKVFLNTTLSNNNTIIKGEVLKNGVAQPGHAIVRSIGYLEFTQDVYVTPNDIISIQISRLGDTNSVLFDGMNSRLQITIPASALARGPEGVPGNPNWSFLSGFGIPSPSLGVHQDLYLNKTNSDLYRKAGSNWQFELNIKGATGPAGITRYMIFAERNGNLNNNSEQWSFGSGSTTRGRELIMMGSGRITKMSYHAVTAGSRSTSVEILKNGISTGQSITTLANQNKTTITFTTPITFVDGDGISFRTVLAGGAGNARVAALVELN
ncbi:MAG: hypothetical protein PHY47_00090 [Lachnospiraceae bacterium]|nr:hypothetical protein [Lachnospiraceae bacterium]